VTAVRVGMNNLRKWRRTFIADRRGAASWEFVIVYPFLLMVIMLPLADVGIAGFQFISARQALRAFGQSIQYSPPTDFSNTASWESAAVAKADPRYPIDALEVLCGEAAQACANDNLAVPRYYSYSTSITLAPMVVSALCNPSCTYTLTYSERFH
jgi:hypothetical protein